jgi:hypothetical protein
MSNPTLMTHLRHQPPIVQERRLSRAHYNARFVPPKAYRDYIIGSPLACR